MTFSYIPQLICLLTGLIGIHSGIITVSKVSVQARHSISIPCLYEPRYTDHVKYLCKGQTWISCQYAVRTDKPDNSGKFSISDDTNQRIFTVTINDLLPEDNHYWCAVEIKQKPDIRQYFQLSVTTGMPSLSVDQQEIVAFEGGSVTVICRYKNNKVTAWCRLGSTCVTVTDQTGTIDGTIVTINQSVPNVFNVTMSELRANSRSWYLCKSRNFQMPVHITVHELTSTTMTTMTTTTTTSTSTTTTTVRSSTAETLPTTPQHSSLLTSAETHTVQPTNPTINGTGGDSLQDEHKISTRAMILITTLTVSLFLLLLVPAAFFGWRIIRRRQVKPEGAHIPAGSQIGSDPDVLYATVVHNQHVAAQNKIEPAEGSVIYSTLHMSRKD